MPSEKTIKLDEIGQLVIAGWTGRNVTALEAHIKELEVLGVARPKSVPIFYRVAHTLLTKSSSIEVVGAASSGEVEFVICALSDGIWVGLGSDHTDRKAETMGVTLSKQMCAKPIGSKLWRYDEVAPHWSKLIIRSFVGVGPARRLYQEGPVDAMRSPEELTRMYRSGRPLETGTAMFCGTFAVRGGVSSSENFEMELEDPELGRKLSHGYTIVQLPIED
jgi:Protein of unknown function (DUF2848)